MGIEERVKDEMYVDTESVLEEEFDRTKDLFNIYKDNTVVLDEDLEDIGPEEEVLIHLIAWQYIAEANEDESAGLPYEYFYEQIDAGKSTIRGYFSDFVDENIVRVNDDEERELVIERLSEVIDRVKGN